MDWLQLPECTLAEQSEVEAKLVAADVAQPELLAQLTRSRRALVNITDYHALVVIRVARQHLGLDPAVSSVHHQPAPAPVIPGSASPASRS